MRFIVMHKVDAIMEAGQLPDQELIKKMGQLIQGSLKSGVFQNGAGLHRSASRARVTFDGGRREIVRAPFEPANELVSQVVMIEARSLDDAIEQAGRFAKIWGDSELEVGPVVQPKDLASVPEHPETREGPYLILKKSSAADERDEKMPASKREAQAALEKELREKGTLLANEVLAPSSKGSRLSSGPRGRRHWVDGPFTETKELIAGFSILELPSKQEALAWADEYAAILGENEVDVRELAAG